MKTKAKPDFQATLDSVDITYFQWCSYVNYARHPKITGVKKARKVVNRVQLIHKIRTELKALLKD